ncbi:MAG: zinc-ribbon domain-containing protein [Lachnospiraceae bacterium]|nr:zinc-ribbon domain-containing protein [Lachnospiraceae bacterium]
MNKTCIQCGKEFEITESEIAFFEEKGLELPKRCKDCRKQNKKNKVKRYRDRKRAANAVKSDQDKKGNGKMENTTKTEEKGAAKQNAQKSRVATDLHTFQADLESDCKTYQQKGFIAELIDNIKRGLKLGSKK